MRAKEPLPGARACPLTRPPTPPPPQERSLLRSIRWEAAVFDEAHKLKGINSSTRATVADMDIAWLLLLTGVCVCV